MFAIAARYAAACEPDQLEAHGDAGGSSASPAGAALPRSWPTAAVTGDAETSSSPEVPVQLGPRSFLTGLWRGLRRRCPCCGNGRLFDGYLRVRPTCGVCGADNDRYPADDAPPYFTILLVGHLGIAPMLLLNVIQTWPLPLSLSVFPTLVLTFTLVLLPSTTFANAAVLVNDRFPDPGVGACRPIVIHVPPSDGLPALPWRRATA